MRYLAFFMVVAVALSASCVFADASSPAHEVYIYKGDDPSSSGIELNAWGSGKTTTSKEKILTGGWSIKVTTQGLYSGGRLDFTQPITLYSNGIDKNRYIQFSLFFTDTKVVNPAAGTISAYDVDPYTIPLATKMRFVFVSDKGTMVSAEEPIGPLDPDDNWVRVAVPLEKFKNATNDPDFRLKRMMIFTDQPKTDVYVGEIKLVTDDSPIKVDPLDSQVVAVMDQVFMPAKAYAGVSSLKYSWDFDSSDGIQAESTDSISSKTYKKGGTYTVTLTVSDADGIKAPVKLTTTVEVND